MKRQCSKDEGGDYNDKISSLPDTVLGHILSFLPIKKAIATSILSKRWHSVWTYLTVLDFDNFNYFRYNRVVAGKMKFAQFVHGVLHRIRAPRTKTFRFWSDDVECNEYDITSWLQVVIARNVEVIDMYCCDKMNYNLPMCLYSCNSLVTLKLHFVTIKYAPAVQFLPSLKDLHLYKMKFHNDECFKKFISGCSALEDIFLDDVTCNSGSYYIFSSTLKRLVIHGSSRSSSEVKFVFNAPVLEYLHIDEVGVEGSRELIAQDLSFISEVNINICGRSTSNDYPCRSWLIKFIDSLYNVKSLSLRVDFTTLLQPYALIPDTMKSLFRNLTELNIGSTMLGLGLVSSFLENSINLQSLSLVKVDESDDQVRWTNPQHVPSCLLSSLKEVSIEGYEGDDLAMIAYVLKNGKVLEMVKLTPLFCYPDYKSKFDLLQKISMLPRGSESCIIEFSQFSCDYC